MNTESMKAFTYKLKMNLLMQEENPNRLVYTMCIPDYHIGLSDYGILDDDYFMDNETVNGSKPSLNAQCGMRVKVSNCELDMYDGSNPFGYDVVADNKPRLQMRLVFWDCESTLLTFKSVPCFSKFKEVAHVTTKGETLYQYFIDCDTNAEAMAEIFNEVQTKVYGMNYDFANEKEAHIITDVYSTEVQQKEVSTKIQMRDALHDYGIPYYKMPMLNSKMHVSKDIMAQMKQMVSEYNDKFAKKRDNYFELIEKEQVLTKRIIPWDSSKKVRTNIFSTMITGHNILKAGELEEKIYDLGATIWEK